MQKAAPLAGNQVWNRTGQQRARRGRSRSISPTTLSSMKLPESSCTGAKLYRPSSKSSLRTTVVFCPERHVQNDHCRRFGLTPSAAIAGLRMRDHQRQLREVRHGQRDRARQAALGEQLIDQVMLAVQDAHAHVWRIEILFQTEALVPALAVATRQAYVFVVEQRCDQAGSGPAFLTRRRSVLQSARSLAAQRCVLQQSDKKHRDTSATVDRKMKALRVRRRRAQRCK